MTCFSEEMLIPVWVSISDGHWKISIHFQKIREITSCTSEKKSDFHMGHVEIWFPHDPWRNHFELLLFDELFGHAEIWFPHDQFSVKWATISPWVMWKSDFWSLVQLVISRIFWKCMEIYQWPSLILTHTGIGFQIYLSFKENVHGIKAEPPLTLTNKPKKRTYDSKKCQICEKVLSNSRNLNDHMKAVHSDKSDKPFKCTLCSYSTHVKIYLNR